MQPPSLDDIAAAARAGNRTPNPGAHPGQGEPPGSGRRIYAPAGPAAGGFTPPRPEPTPPTPPTWPTRPGGLAAPWPGAGGRAPGYPGSVHPAGRAAPARPGSMRLLGLLALVVAVGLLWVGAGRRGSGSVGVDQAGPPFVVRSAGITAGISLTGHEPTPLVLVGAPCPAPVDATAGGPTTLQHRFMTANWHALACRKSDGTTFLYLERRANPTDNATYPAATVGSDTYQATTGSDFKVGWPTGLTRTGATEPVLLERKAIPGPNGSPVEAERCASTAGRTWCS